MSQTLTPQEIAALRTAINLIETKAGRIEINSDRLEQFINNPTGTVTTDGGEVKTIGQAIIDAVAAFNAGTGGTASQTISDINAILSQIRGGADLSTTNLEILRDDVGNSGDPAADTGSLNARDAKRKEDIEAIKGTNYQGSTTLSSLQTALDTLSGLVGSRPSLTYHYFASATASALSSANANTQAVWTWLNRIFTSIRNLDSKITAIKGTGYQTSTTLSSLQQAINSGGGGGGGTPGANGLPGRQMGVFFRESATEPADPVVGEDTSGSYVKVATPSGWSTTRPANLTQKLWMLVQQGQGNVANDTFTETFSSGPIDISPGANGLAGRVWRFFFRRSATAIPAPSVTPYVTAGRVDIQTPTGWSTSIPAGSDTLRMLAQSTQPNAANDGGHHSLSFIIPLPQPASGGGGGTGSGVDEDTFNELANAVGASTDGEDIDGATLWGQFNQVKEWLGEPTQNASDTGSLWQQLKQAIADIGDKVNTITFNALATAVGAVDDAANIAGTTLWNQFNQVKEWLGSPSDPASATGSAFARITQNAEGINANTTAIAGIANAGGLETNTSRVVDDITQEDATQAQWSVGNIIGDIKTGVVKYVKGTPTPIDYTMRMTSIATTSPNESLIDGHWVFGYTRENVSFPNITNTISGSTLGELNPTVTGDLGDDIDAILNVTNHSLSSGYMMVIMKVDADYVPKRLRLKQGTNIRVDHSLELAQTTTTHKIYVTAHSDDLQWGDVFGLSSAGAFTADLGFSDEAGDNYLQGNIVKSFADFPLSKYTRTYFGNINDLVPVEKPGDLFIATNGDILISKEIAIAPGAVNIFPLTKDEIRYGWGHETPGARCSLPRDLIGNPDDHANNPPQITAGRLNKIQYHKILDEIIIDSKEVSPFVLNRLHTSVIPGDGWYSNVSIFTGFAGRGGPFAPSYDVIVTPSVVKPEADTEGLYARYAGCKSPVNDAATGFKHITITPGYSGTAQTLFGESMSPIIGMKKTQSGYSFGDSSNDDVWRVGDQIYVDRSISDRALRFKTRAESHAEIENMVYGEKLTFEEEGSLTGGSGGTDNRRLHFRIPARNASGALATQKGSRTNAAFNTGIYEVDLKFGEAGSFVHLPVPAGFISGNQKLALFLKPVVNGDANDFEKMNLQTDKYYVLTYHSKIHDYGTGGGNTAANNYNGYYSRYKWDLPADAMTQLRNHFDADINGSMFVGIAIIEESGTGNQRAISNIVRSWLPVPYKQIYVNGVHIDMTIENLSQIRIQSGLASRMEVQYKTNAYTNQQREKYYLSALPETIKDIIQDGVEIAVNVLNREGMYHIPFDITHLKPFVADEPFTLLLRGDPIGYNDRAFPLAIGENWTSFFLWQRIVRSYQHSTIFNTTGIEETGLEVVTHTLELGRFDTLEGEPDFIRQERLAIDSNNDNYPSKYLAIPFSKGTMYERAADNAQPNDMDDSDLHGTKEAFAVDSDHIDGSVIIEDLYLNADNTGTNEVYFRVGRGIDESTANLPATIIHHPRSGSTLTIPAVSANSVRATKVYRNDKRQYKVSSDADWSAGFPGLKEGDKISVQLMGGQAHNNPQLVWYKLIN